MATSETWQRNARRILRAELARRDVDYKKLSQALDRIGIKQTPKVLSNKVTRGTFTFAFFLQCMKALGIESITFKDL